MAIRRIVTSPNPTLRKPAHKVKSFGEPLQRLIDDMIETMRAAPGVGLAAPQIEVGQRVIVVEYAESSEETDAEVKPKLYVMVNPEILRTTRETCIGQEACLSLPGYIGEVERFEAVTIRAQDRHGRPIRMKAKGWLARIFQHEIDHLNGVLYIDRASQIWRVEEADQAHGVLAV